MDSQLFYITGTKFGNSPLQVNWQIEQSEKIQQKY